MSWLSGTCRKFKKNVWTRLNDKKWVVNMYKVLDVDRDCSHETFFWFRKFRNRRKITCFEPGNFSDDYQITDEYIRRIHERLEHAKKNNNENTIKYCLLELRMLED